MAAQEPQPCATRIDYTRVTFLVKLRLMNVTVPLSCSHKRSSRSSVDCHALKACRCRTDAEFRSGVLVNNLDAK